MAENGLQVVNMDEMIAVMASLTSKQMTSANKAALRKCGNKLLTATRRLIRERVNTHGKTSASHPGEVPVQKAGQVFAAKNGQSVTVALRRVDWRARILEVGSYRAGVRTIRGKQSGFVTKTNRRYTHAGAQRGYLRPRAFFLNAQLQVNKEMEQIMATSLEKEMKKRFERGKK